MLFVMDTRIFTVIKGNKNYFPVTKILSVPSWS